MVMMKLMVDYFLILTHPQDFCEGLRLEESSDGQACVRAVENELLVAYHKYEDTNTLDAAGYSFSHIRQQDLPPRLPCHPSSNVMATTLQTFNAFYRLTGDMDEHICDHHTMYIPVQLKRVGGGAYAVTAELDMGHGRPPVCMDYLPHHAPVAVAQQLCQSMSLPCTECPLESLVAQLKHASADSTPIVAQVPRLLLSLDLEMSDWSSGHARKFVLYEGEDVRRRAASFCAVNRCPDRINQVSQVVQMVQAFQYQQGSQPLELPPMPPNNRVVVSLSTIPSRIHHVAQRVLDLLKKQTRTPDHVYLALPHRSVREQTSYILPESLLRLAETMSDKFTIIRSSVDWGPATKLIPVLEAEVDPMTAIITVDDDVNYPCSLVEELERSSRRLPNAVLGFKGFRLPASGPYRHDRFQYIGSESESSDTLVDVLGGVTGVLYRSGFFDYDRLTDYLHHPSAAFYVDDEWIAGALAESGIPRVVLSRDNAPHTTAELFHDERLFPYHEEGALNGNGHAHRNMLYQEMLLTHLKKRNGDRSMGYYTGSFVLDVYDHEYSPVLGQRALSFRETLLWLEGLGPDHHYVMVETGTVSHEDAARWGFSGQATLIFDRFINYYQGTLYTVRDLGSLPSVVMQRRIVLADRVPLVLAPLIVRYCADVSLGDC